MSKKPKKRLLALGVAAALAAGGGVYVASTSDQPFEVVATQPIHTICYHRHTGQVIVALPYGHEWGPGENREPLATADVDLPPDFRVQDLALRRWEYRGGKMVRVPGVKPAVVIVPPEPPEDSP
jgi:hypothetical protein